MRDSPTVRAALKALSQGGAVASPHTQFHLLDPGFLCGQVEAVVKLMNHQNMRRPSLPHIRVLRVNNRLAFNAVASAARSVQQLQGSNCKGSSVFPSKKELT